MMAKARAVWHWLVGEDSVLLTRGKEQVRLGTTVGVHPRSKCYANGGISSGECPVLSSAGHTVLRMCVDSM